MNGRAFLSDELVRSLETAAVHKTSCCIAGRNLIIASSKEQLLGTLTRLIPESPGHDSFEANGAEDFCIIENSSLLQDVIGMLPAVPDRVYTDEHIGTGNLYYFADLTVIAFEGIGALLQLLNGMMIILINEESPLEQSGKCLNIVGLAGIMSMEMVSRAGKMLIHGGCVAKDGSCIVFTGESGSGKTTRVFDLAIQGWNFLGDDMVILGRDSHDVWSVWPYFLPVKISNTTCQMFPELQGLVRESTNGSKHVIPVEELPALKKGGKGTLNRIYFLTTDEQERCVRLSASDAIHMLSRTFLSFVNIQHAHVMLENVLDIASTIPMYVLSRGYINSNNNFGENLFVS